MFIHLSVNVKFHRVPRGSAGFRQVLRVPPGSTGFRQVPRGSVPPGFSGFGGVSDPHGSITQCAPRRNSEPRNPNPEEPCGTEPVEPSGTSWNPVEPSSAEPNPAEPRG